MISCPNCQKDIADDSVHCGYCGAEIETGGGKKTMMGFGAVTSDMIRQAAEDAKKARIAAEIGDQPSESKLKIPKPVVPVSSEESATGLPNPSKLTIPKIGGAPAAADDDAAARTEALPSVEAEQRPSAPATIEEMAPASASPAEPAVQVDWATSQTDPPGAPGAWSGPTQSEDEEWSMGPGAHIGAESTSPELDASDSGNPLRLGEPLPGGAVIKGSQNLPAKKSSKAILIPVIGAVVVFGGCCASSVLYGLFAA